MQHIWESLDNAGDSNHRQLLLQTPSFSNYFDNLQIIKRGAGRWTSANGEGCKPLTGAKDQVSSEDKGLKAQRKRQQWHVVDTGLCIHEPEREQEVFYDAKLFP